MTCTLSFFPVGNGDMTLLELESGRKILIDLNIRAAADDLDDETPDVAEMLCNRLKRDTQRRRYVDALLVTHPDKDHCTGLRKHFHLGPPNEWSPRADKIFVREIWSSPMVFRYASRNHGLCDDAKAFNREARRRVQQFRETGGSVIDGNRILILGEDEVGKTDDLKSILICVDQEFSRVNGQNDGSMTARLLGPLRKKEGDDEEVLSKNNSSTILRFSLAGAHVSDKCRFLTGGDAQVTIWEKLWQRHRLKPDRLSYDILQVPHHCSWHSLSYDSWSELGEKAEVCEDARSALSQTRHGATIVASSDPIKDDDNDPPCIRARREYVGIVANVNGVFKCVGEYPTEGSPGVMEFEVTRYGLKLRSTPMESSSVRGPGIIGRQPLSHG